MRAQALGLANRLGGSVTEKVVGLRAPWRWASAGQLPWPLLGQDPARTRLAPPWPDLLISCGRRTAVLALGVKAASGGRTLCVHIQDPRAHVAKFDRVIAMAHDPVHGRNVLRIATALHPVTPERLAAEGAVWTPRLSALPRPLTGVLLGGSTHQQPFTQVLAERLLVGLEKLRAAGQGLAITPSRRTPDDVLALVRERFSGDPGVFVWDREGDNPYFGILALADRLVVTSDSVSMISEALAAPGAVEVFDLKAARHQRFLGPLLLRSFVRLFTGDPAPPQLNRTPDPNLEAEQFIRVLLEAKGLQASTGVSG
jgi:mitochondrial fission protein ELM1